jgi:hypothetical protein
MAKTKTVPARAKDSAGPAPSSRKPAGKSAPLRVDRAKHVPKRPQGKKQGRSKTMSQHASRKHSDQRLKAKNRTPKDDNSFPSFPSRFPKLLSQAFPAGASHILVAHSTCMCAHYLLLLSTSDCCLRCVAPSMHALVLWTACLRMNAFVGKQLKAQVPCRNHQVRIEEAICVLHVYGLGCECSCVLHACAMLCSLIHVEEPSDSGQAECR